MNSLLQSRFIAQSTCSEMANVVFADLEPRHRALLVNDGTVTPLLEAFVLEPVETRCVWQETRMVTPLESKWLELDANCEVHQRKVVIVGQKSKFIYIRAESVLVRDRLPSWFLDSMRGNGASIGTTLTTTSVENRRELLWFEPGNSDEVVARTYRIIVASKPAILVSEGFL